MFFIRKIKWLALAVGLSSVLAQVNAVTLADFKVVKASHFIDADFSLTAYAKSLGADETMILSGLEPKKISERHVIYPIMIHRDGVKPEVHILVLGHGFQLDAFLVYDAADFMMDPVGMMAAIHEDYQRHELFYPGRIKSYELFSGVGRLTPIKKASSGGVYSLARGNEGHGFESVTLDNLFSQGNESGFDQIYEDRALYFRGKLHQMFMSNVDLKNGRLLRTTLYGYGGGCVEEASAARLACQRERYELSIKEGVLYVDRYPIERPPIHLVAAGIQEAGQQAGQSRYDVERTFVAVEPLTSTGDVSIVRTDSNPLLEDLATVYGISLNPTAITFGNAVSGFRHSTAITSATLPLSECRYAMMTRGSKGKGQEDRLISLDLCSMKSSLKKGA